MSRNSYFAPNQAQALLGAWQQIVGAGMPQGQALMGWQNSGVPTQLNHGVYGGHQAAGFRPNMQGWGYPPTRMGAEMPVPPPHHHHHGHGHGGHPGFGEFPVAFAPPPPPTYYTQVPPRNALIDYPGPSRADRVILPMSSGVNILPNTSAQITARPQNVAFRPERIVLGGNAGDWVINDVKVGNRSQFSQSGDIPGEMFAATTIDSFISFETVQTAMDFVILTTFVGASESGAPFVCGVLGTAAI